MKIKNLLWSLFYMVVGGCFFYWLFLSVFDKSEKERVDMVEYVDYIKGNEVISDQGNVLYFTTEALYTQGIKKGALLDFESRNQKNDTIDAKVLYYEWRDYSGEVPSYYDGEWRGVCVVSPNDLTQTVEFASKVEPAVGKRYTFISFVELGGEKSRWILQNQ
jgi:hypothetical protein